MTTPTPEEVRVPDPSAERTNSAVRRGQTTQLDPHMHFVVSRPQNVGRTTTIGHAVLAPPAPVPAEAPAPRAIERKRNAREMDSIAAPPVETQPLRLERAKSSQATTREISPEERQRAMAEFGNLSLLPALPQAVPNTPNPPEVLTRSMSMEAMLSAPAEPPFLGQSAHVAQLPAAVSASPAPQLAAASRTAPVQQLEVAPTQLMDAVGFRPRRRGSRPFLLVTMVLVALGVTGGSLYLKRHPTLLQPHAKPVIALVQRGVKLVRAGLAQAGAKPRRTATSRPAAASADPKITRLKPPDEARAEPLTRPEEAPAPKQLARKSKQSARAKRAADEAARAAQAAAAESTRASAAPAPRQAAAEAETDSAGPTAAPRQQAAAVETKASAAGAAANLAQVPAPEAKADAEGAPTQPGTRGQQAAPVAESAESGALFASPHVAAELYIAGRYKEALAEYRTLATLNPEVRSYAQFARILRKRLVEICVRTQPHRQAECEQL